MEKIVLWKRIIGFLRLKSLLSILTFSLILFATAVFADENVGVGRIASTLTQSFAAIGKLMIATAYIAGIGFSIAAIFKFKQHRDNPTQIPIGTPIALLGVGVILIFLPGIIAPVGETLFGTGNVNTAAGGFTGSGANTIPGAEK